MVKAKKTYKNGGKITPKTTATAKGGSVDGMARKNFMKARGKAAEHMRGTAQMAGKDDKPAKSLEKREYKKGGKIVAQGADKKDVRREKKQERKEAKAVKREKRAGDRNFKRDVKSGKLKKVSDEKSKTRTIGNRTVIKQKNKSDDGVRSTRKTVYGGNQAQRLVTKEKQRTNRKGKKAGMISFKEKEVDRKDFSVRRKTKGITPNSGS